jgi:hypothetical protein
LLVATSKDFTTRILCLKKVYGGVKYKPFLFLGRRDVEGDLMVEDDDDADKKKGCKRGIDVFQ